MFISRLHRDGSGLASIEVVLGLPVFLIMLLVLKHTFTFSLTRIQNLVSDRMSTWHYARNEGNCTASYALSFVTMKYVAVPPSCSDISDQSLTENDKFWSDLRQAASWTYNDLFSPVSGAPAHEWGKAEVEVPYIVTDLRFNPFTMWKESYIVPKARFLMFDDGSMDRGYNGPIRDAINSRTIGPFIGSMGLFPGLFGQQ